MSYFHLIEAISFAVVPITVIGFWLVLKRNVIGDMIAGTLIGCFVELFTASYWTTTSRSRSIKICRCACCSAGA